MITLKMLDGFKKARHEQLAVTSSWTNGDFNQRLAAIGIAEVQMPFGFFSKRLDLQSIRWTANFMSRLPWLWIKWRRVLRSFRPDVVIFTGSRLLLPVLPLLPDCVIALIEYTNVPPTKLRGFISRLFAKHIDVFVGVSDFMGSHLEAIGAPSEQIRVVKSGPLTAEERLRLVSERANTTRLGKPLRRIGIVGQISRSKGHDTLVEAARLLKAMGHQFTILVYGAGSPEYVSELRERIATAQLVDEFTWSGYVREKDTLYGGIEICVVPSCFDDPLPTVAIEAGAYALPTVVSRAGGLPEIVSHGVTGWIVDPGEPAQLADRLAWLLTHPREAAAMGISAQEKVFKEFTQERMVSESERLFQELRSAHCAADSAHAH